MRPFNLNHLAKQGDLPALRALLTQATAATHAQAVNTPDRQGLTPLMHAARSPAASADVIRLLLQAGANPNEISPSEWQLGAGVMSMAMMQGDPHKVRALLDHGGDVHYKDPHGYGALLNAVHGRDIKADPHLITLLQLLIKEGVSLNDITDHGESALRVLSNQGRFDAVYLLLSAGADLAQLEWTPLMLAVAIGTLADMRSVLQKADEPDHDAMLKAVDNWSRTAWLLAIHTGDIDKARLLREHGADTNARGHCDKPALFYAVDSRQLPMLQYLLDTGFNPDDADEFGRTALIQAVEVNEQDAVRLLLQAGAKLDAEEHGMSALNHASTSDMALLLLDAGADPQTLSQEATRALLGLPTDMDEAALADLPPEDFQRARTRRFGVQNPQEMNEPFWLGMIRSGLSAYAAHALIDSGGDSSDGEQPVWSAQRFGQSITFLPDGRIVQIGGEHEDSYDPNFCIYNDVFVHEPDGTIRLFGYPEAIFPPTDFHTATLMDDGHIYVIGRLGYRGQREFGHTPVYRLDTRTMHIEPVPTSGDAPGWLYRHKATPISADEIKVEAGNVARDNDDGEEHEANEDIYVLNVSSGAWTRL